MFRNRSKQPEQGEHVDALRRAKRVRREAEDGLAEQRARVAREHKDIIVPLRELRKRNHFADMIVAQITAGWGKEDG